jgi:hypothetical protein
MKIVELIQQLKENHIFLNFDLPQEYKNQKVKIIIFPFDDIIPDYSIIEKEVKAKNEELWFMELDGIDLNSQTFSREEMYDDSGR